MIANLGMEDQYTDGLMELGLNLENIAENGEKDLDRGCCGRCRQAACTMDSLSTCNIPAIGYGIRFDFGDNQQQINIKGECTKT